MTKLLKCTCQHDAQDKIHNGLRVMNLMVKKIGTQKQYRCTVCNRIHLGKHKPTKETPGMKVVGTITLKNDKK